MMKNKNLEILIGFKNFFKYILSFLIFWRYAIILGILSLFAFYVFVIFLLHIHNLPFLVVYKVIILSLFIFFLNFMMAQLFPEKFLGWNFNQTCKIILRREYKKIEWTLKLKCFIASFIFLAAYLVMSISLSIYIFTYISDEINKLWQKSLLILDPLYKFAAFITIITFSYIPIIFLISGIFYYLFNLLFYLFIGPLDKKENQAVSRILIKIIILFLVNSAFVVILVFLILTNQDVIALLDNLFKSFFEKLIDIYTEPLAHFIKFLVGFIPMGWFYELIIGSNWKNLLDYYFN